MVRLGDPVGRRWLDRFLLSFSIHGVPIFWVRRGRAIGCPESEPSDLAGLQDWLKAAIQKGFHVKTCHWLTSCRRR